MDQHVSLMQQFQEYFIALGAFKIQANAALATVNADKRPTLCFQCRWILAQIIPLGRFDFDHFCAQVGQQRATVRPGNIGAQIQHLDTGQGQCIVS